MEYRLTADPPRLRMEVVPLEPAVAEAGGVYGGWGQGAFGPDGRFYFAVGKHRTDDRADAWLVVYDPADGSTQRVMSTRDTAGWGDDARAMVDGKLYTAID
ncbi:MAG: hypothetical protein AAF800_07660 [Planctomycetota bacterium]